MSGTPPLGPAATLTHVLLQTLAARWVPALLTAVVVLAAAVALAAPARAQAPAACPFASEPLWTAPPGAVASAIGCLVNAERVARGVPAAAPSSDLEEIAGRHATDMVARRYFAHVSPSGGTVDKRARRAGYLTAPCWALGEDLGWAPADVANAQAVVAAWMASPSHRSVILDPDFREIGVGIVGRPPTGTAPGATFVLEMGAMRACARQAAGSIRSAPRARIRVS
jgi:uncharacterized protein YkwD